MPIFEFKCERCGTTFERLVGVNQTSQGMSCNNCGGNCQKVLSVPNLKFIGPGFYSTDYRPKFRVTEEE